VNLISLDDLRWSKLDYIVVSPGIPLRYPTPHKILQIATENSIPIISDVEILFQMNKNVKFIGITGTNGKSTTTALLGHILQDYGLACGGNIGLPCLLLPKASGYVLELSSYQLDLLTNFKPHIAAITNITPDHLDRYASMQDYISSKISISRHMDKTGYLVINIDDEVLSSLKNNFSHTNLITISAKSNRADIFYAENKIHDQISGQVLEFDPPKCLQGKHNLYNILTAYAVSKNLSLDPAKILDKIISFKGIAHRLQYLGSHNKIVFYNDSKATNAEAAANALLALNNIFWLAGGLPKQGGISSIAHLLHNVKKAYFFGQAANDFAMQTQGKIHFATCETMAEAFKQALYDATILNDNCNIVLSPACASFDQFKNFEERGNYFIALFNQVKI
jgi:UDP-N-acetylmuramoylalanine--D-glutamate ligase